MPTLESAEVVLLEAPVVTPLSTLLAAARAGREVCDEKLREAWGAETWPDRLLEVVRSASDGARTDAAYKAFLNDDSERHICQFIDEDRVECPACCDAIRAAVACPNWAELTKGRE